MWEGQGRNVDNERRLKASVKGHAPIGKAAKPGGARSEFAIAVGLTPSEDSFIGFYGTI